MRKRVNKFLAENAKKDVEPYFFSAKQIKFLEVYSKTLDLTLACEQSGVLRNKIHDDPYLQHEIKMIEEMAIYAHRVNSAMGNHMRLMAKIEDEFNSTEDAKERTGFASTLAKMSDSALKAAGKFNEKPEAPSQQNVQVVINIGGSRDERQPQTIDEESHTIDIEAS